MECKWYEDEHKVRGELNEDGLGLDISVQKITLLPGKSKTKKEPHCFHC